MSLPSDTGTSATPNLLRFMDAPSADGEGCVRSCSSSGFEVSRIYGVQNPWDNAWKPGTIMIDCTMLKDNESTRFGPVPLRVFSTRVSGSRESKEYRHSPECGVGSCRPGCRRVLLGFAERSSWSGILRIRGTRARFRWGLMGREDGSEMEPCEGSAGGGWSKTRGKDTALEEAKRGGDKTRYHGPCPSL